MLLELGSALEDGALDAGTDDAEDVASSAGRSRGTATDVCSAGRSRGTGTFAAPSAILAPLSPISSNMGI